MKHLFFPLGILLVSLFLPIQAQGSTAHTLLKLKAHPHGLHGLLFRVKPLALEAEDVGGLMCLLAGGAYLVARKVRKTRRPASLESQDQRAG